MSHTPSCELLEVLEFVCALRKPCVTLALHGRYIPHSRRRVRAIAFVVFFCLAALPTELICAEDDSYRPYGLTTRIPWTTSRVVGTPEPPPPYTVKRAFPRLTFKNPLFIAQEPGTGRLLVAELAGKIRAFSPDNPDFDSTELFLDIKRQIYAFSFHPQYEQNGYIFVFSPQDPAEKPENQNSRVSRFQAVAADGETPRRCAAETEKIIFEWPAGGHNGGEAIFGPDGYLYIATGDGTSGSDLDDTGQGVDDLLSVIVRIDVDHPQPDKAYSIPQDNPFVQMEGARPEVWAHGFRNPWRMSFDSETGRLWVGDVGQDLWEMIWLVERGGNFGWSVQEGSHPFHLHKKQGPGPIQPPVVEHHHTECRSITGGYVYHGTKFPELKDVYFYGDYEYGKIWGLRHDGQQVTWHKELADTFLRIPSFGVSSEGNIYLMDHTNGELYELTRAEQADASSSFPRRLSETGLFADVAKHAMSPGIVPYSVNAPQWIDNGVKQRFLALPGTSQMTFVEKSGDANTWKFEDGAVTVETISLDMEVGNTQSRRRIESRMMVKQENHWLGYSYLWNDEETDATLVDVAGTNLNLTITDPDAPGGKRQQTWRVPSRNECMGCHSRAADFVLGLCTAQINRDHNYGAVIDNQLRAFNHVGLFTKPLPKRPDEFNPLPDPYDDSANLDARARAYLHVNCSVCHVTNGGGNAKMALRYDEMIEATKIVGVAPLHGSFGLTDAKIIAPGDPFASVLLYRFAKLGSGRMPHVGSRLTDQRGLDLMHDWILNFRTPNTETNEAPASAHADFDSPLAALQSARSSAAERKQAIEQLLASTRGAFVLAHVLGRGANGPTLRPARDEAIALAMAHPDVNIRDLFERYVPESERTQRLGNVVNAQAILAMTGSVENGRKLFASAASLQCKICHRIDGTVGTLGPDLSKVGKQYKRHELLESLIGPSKKIDPKFVTHLLVTTSGKVFSGIVVEKTETETVLNVLQEGNAKLVRVPTAEIEELVPQKTSLMPEGLLRNLTAQQAADLVDFLASLK